MKVYSCRNRVAYSRPYSKVYPVGGVVLHDRTEHIDIRYHFVRELVEGLKIDIVYIQTKEMIADLLTKVVSKNVFEALIGKLFGKEM